jgi:hypothetical protein
LTDFIERGLLDQIPPPDEDVEFLVDMKMERRAYGRAVVEETRRASAVFVLGLSVFAVEGPMDLLLAVVPAHKLGKLFGKGKEAMELARAERLGQKHMDEIGVLLDKDKNAAAFLHWAAKISDGQRRALFVIHRRTGSEAVVTRLLRHQAEYDADVEWIAARLAQADARLASGESAVLVRRFTFGEDLLEDITLYKANPSWGALQKVVEKKPIAPAARASLASKVDGLLGERAAYERLADPGVMRKLLGRDGRFKTIDRGVPYGRGSMDIVAYTEENALVVAEVKNWAMGTWADPRSRARLMEQLARHDAGIPKIRRDGDEVVSGVRAKVLFVAEDGFLAWGDDEIRNDFIELIARRGWVVELIPSQQIRTFGELIDAIR